MAKPRSPRGRHSPMLAVRVSPDEMRWFKAHAEDLGMNAAQLQRDRLLFDMPGYKTLEAPRVSAPEQSADVECPRCGAGVGQQCRMMVSSDPKRIGAPRLPHQERFERLKARRLKP